MAGEYINSKAGKKRIKKQWKSREKKDELHTFKDTTEFAVHKGQIYKTIVVDHETGRIVYVGNGRSKEALAKFWRRVKRLKVKIEVVSSDLSAAFISSVGQNAPDAIHVYDKFHIVQLVAQVMDKTRRSVYKQTTDMEQRKVIKGNRWILLRKDPENQTRSIRRDWIIY